MWWYVIWHIHILDVEITQLGMAGIDKTNLFGSIAGSTDMPLCFLETLALCWILVILVIWTVNLCFIKAAWKLQCTRHLTIWKMQSTRLFKKIKSYKRCITIVKVLWNLKSFELLKSQYDRWPKCIQVNTSSKTLKTCLQKLLSTLKHSHTTLLQPRLVKIPCK